MDKIRIDKEYVAAMLIELLFEKGLVNKETYMNIYKLAAIFCTFHKWLDF